MGRHPFGKPRRRREDVIKTHVKILGQKGVDSFNVVQQRNQRRKYCEHGNEHFGSMKGRECPE